MCNLLKHQLVCTGKTDKHPAQEMGSGQAVDFLAGLPYCAALHPVILSGTTPLFKAKDWILERVGAWCAPTKVCRSLREWCQCGFSVQELY